MACVYILYSEKLDKFYIGASALDPKERLTGHNTERYENKFTSNGIPWTLFWHLDTPSLQVAFKIERHIKNMKSKTYICNLKRYPEISAKLLKNYVIS